MIRIRDLHKYYSGHHLFKGINLEVAKGEVVVCIGPSGSGKSTFLRCINGLELFQQGEIVVDGMELHSINRQRPAAKDLETMRQVRLKVGMVFQQFNLFPHMTVLENIIEAPIQVRGADRAATIAQARALLRRINIEQKAESFPDELSGGEQQRVAIARALALNPPLILADEPTGELDSATGRQILAIFRKLASAEGLTVIIATHDLTVNEYATVTYELQDGQLR